MTDLTGEVLFETRLARAGGTVRAVELLRELLTLWDEGDLVVYSSPAGTAAGLTQAGIEATAQGWAFLEMLDEDLD